MQITEIFWSFQGEGLYIGVPQLFIRFAGCNLQCPYCDEPQSLKSGHAYTPDMLMAEIKPLLKRPVHSISLTGGEPLLQVDAIKAVLPELPRPVFLETNATLPGRLEEIAGHITYFSLDFKPGYEREFADSLVHIKDRSGVYVKYVVLRDFLITELEQCCRSIAAINADIPLILQPVTPVSGIKSAKPQDSFRAFNTASRHLKTVRVIPQAHKLIGIK